MGREQCALLVEEPTSCFICFETGKKTALLKTVSPVYTHIMSHVATWCQGITIFCYYSQHIAMPLRYWTSFTLSYRSGHTHPGRSVHKWYWGRCCDTIISFCLSSGGAYEEIKPKGSYSSDKTYNRKCYSVVHFSVPLQTYYLTSHTHDNPWSGYILIDKKNGTARDREAR